MVISGRTGCGPSATVAASTVLNDAHLVRPSDVLTRVLIAAADPIGDRSAGPAIRAAHMARVIGSRHDVTLASLGGPSTSPVDRRVVVGLDDVSEADIDVAIMQGRVSLARADLLESSLPVAFDWFDPFHLEALHRGGTDRIRRMDLVEGARQTLIGQAHRGDFFICSNQSQRDHWLGFLASVGRVNHLTHDADTTFRSLIDVAPFGVAAETIPGGSPARAEFSVIGPEDPIVLWAGGLHDWLDPLAVIDAMPQVLEANPDTRLVFLAGPHPNTAIETMGVRGDAISRARALGLFGTHVLFVTRWVDHGNRLAWFAEATVGVVTHSDHVEAQYSHRTRLFDHLAVGLPTVCSAGDPAGKLLRGSGAATTVPPGDPDALAAAIAHVITDDGGSQDSMRSAALTLGAAMRWEQTLAPLVDWIGDAQPAADRIPGAVTGESGGAGTPNPLARLAGRARMHLDEGGARQLAERAVRAGRRRLGR